MPPAETNNSDPSWRALSGARIGWTLPVFQRPPGCRSISQARPGISPPWMRCRASQPVPTHRSVTCMGGSNQPGSAPAVNCVPAWTARFRSSHAAPDSPGPTPPRADCIAKVEFTDPAEPDGERAAGEPEAPLVAAGSRLMGRPSRKTKARVRAGLSPAHAQSQAFEEIAQHLVAAQAEVLVVGLAKKR